jgi:hypothetical protein
LIKFNTLSSKNLKILGMQENYFSIMKAIYKRCGANIFKANVEIFSIKIVSKIRRSTTLNTVFNTVLDGLVRKYR